MSYRAPPTPIVTAFRPRTGSRDDSCLPTIRERENSFTTEVSSHQTPSGRGHQTPTSRSSVFSSLDDSSVGRDSQCALYDYRDLEIDVVEDYSSPGKPATSTKLDLKPSTLKDFATLSRALGGLLRTNLMEHPLPLQQFMIPVLVESLR